ncbi:MAG TPA: NIL domain-containing protein [Verrucomicrobiae bacterium]|jgi:hypothetical protein
MATKTKKAGGVAAKLAAGSHASGGKQKLRFWLMYPPKLITRPVVWELGHKFKLVTNVRQASVTDEIGIVCLELEGERTEIKAGVKWLEGFGVRVEPVEINVIES